MIVSEPCEWLLLCRRLTAVAFGIGSQVERRMKS